MKKARRKEYQCKSVAVKTENFPELYDYSLLSFWNLKVFTHISHASCIWEWIIVVPTTVLSQNGIWHVYFFFMLKHSWNPLLYIPSICSNLICFKVQMTVDLQLGLDKPIMKSIFEPEEDMNCFDKFVWL